MDKIKLCTAALLLVCLTVCLFVLPIAAAEGTGGLFGLPRAAESVVDDITGAVSDAIGDMTGDNADRPYDGEGTNIPEDSTGSITDNDPVTDPVTTAPSTTDNRTTANTTGAGTDTDSAAEDEGASGFVGIVIAIIAAIAVVLLIIALMPRKKTK